MTIKQIKSLLLVCPPTGNDGGDPRLKKALQAAQKDPELRAAWDTQVKFDRRVADGLRAIAPPPSLMAAATNVESHLSHRTVPTMSLRDPAILSVVIAFVLLVGLGIWLVFGKMSSFPGASETWEIVSMGDSAPADRLEPITLKLDVLDDWFAMKGMDQFWAPTELGNLDVVGARLFYFADIPVAMGVGDQPLVSFYAFNGTRLGISVPTDGKWKLVTRDRKAIAVTGQGDMVFVIEIDGDRTDLQRILHQLYASKYSEQ